MQKGGLRFPGKPPSPLLDNPLSLCLSAPSSGSGLRRLKLLALKHLLHGRDGALEHAVVGLVGGQILHLHARPQHHLTSGFSGWLPAQRTVIS